MPTLLLCSATDNLQTLCDEFVRTAKRMAPDLTVVLWPQPYDAADVVAVAVWHPPAGLLPALPNLKFIASIGAGIEHIRLCPDLPAGVPITRIVDSAQADGMAEYVLWAALHYHRGFDRMLAQQKTAVWRMPPQSPAKDFAVGVMGLGGMGKQVALRLRDNGFAVSAWTRSAHALDGVDCYTGTEALHTFLAGQNMVVCLLPLTDATQGICNAPFFAAMRPGAAFVNVGRGPHVVLPDLLHALDNGHLRGAVLDVFDHEPIAADEALWSHPKIVITPHMASSASDASIAEQIVGNALRTMRGQALLHTVTAALQY